MRIAYVCQSYPPMVSGAALVAQRLAEQTAARGHDVLVLAASDRRRGYVERSGRLEIAHLCSYRNPVRVGQRFSLWPCRGVSAALRAFRPGLVHLQDPLLVGLCGLRTAQALGLPVVLTVHQLPWFVSRYLPPLPGLPRAVEALLWRYAGWFAKQCQVVVTPSQVAAGIIEAHIGGNPQVISNGIDLERFAPTPAFPGEREALCEKYGLDPGLPVILHVGRLDVDKQVDVVVRAAAHAMRSAEAQLLVVGDGTQRATLVELSTELGIEARSCFPGFVPLAGDLPGLYRLALAFVIASELETQGVVVLEAMAAGRPVVAARAGAIPELVQDGANGYLVPPGDELAMAARLVTLLQDHELACRLGRAGRTAVEGHSVASAVAAHEQLYRRLLPCQKYPPSRTC